MSEKQQSGRKAFLDALAVKRNAIWGFSFGFAVTALVYILFIVVLSGSFELVRGAYYLTLALSMALGVGGLTTAVLVALRARRLSKEL